MHYHHFHSTLRYCPNVTFDDAKSMQSLYHLQTTGANWVAIVVTQYQHKHNSTIIFPLYEPLVTPYYTYLTATPQALATVILQAHSMGLKVMLKPHVDITDDPEYWRGQIGLGFKPEQWELWFASYRTMLLEYANLAQQLGVEMFSVSCELIEASKQDAHWRRLIADVRKVYHGPLVSSANWGWLNATGGEETNKTVRYTQFLWLLTYLQKLVSVVGCC